MRERKVEKCQYYVCGTCVKNGREKELAVLQSEGQILSITFNAAGPFYGYNIKYPNKLEQEALQRAKNLVSIAFPKNQTGQHHGISDIDSEYLM